MNPRSLGSMFGALFLLMLVQPAPAKASDLKGVALRPEIFFAGHTTGRGTMVSEIDGTRELYRVDNFGHRERDAFVLEQTISYPDRVEHRTWHIRRIAPNRYSADVSDAAAPFEIEADGPNLRFSYPLKAIPTGRIEQTLSLQPDGRQLSNSGIVTVLGLPVRRIEEKIRR